MDLFHHFIQLASEDLAVTRILRGSGEHQIDCRIEFLAGIGYVVRLIKPLAVLQPQIGLLHEYLGIGAIFRKLE
ncbi:MAG: hypothetical protein WDO73_33395 [Ignavibacteriota bacterium]